MLILLPVFLLISILPGCGGADNSASPGTGSDEAQRTPASTGAAVPGGIRSTNDIPSGQSVRLVFIHHSVGEDWLDDTKGGLGKALMDNNYFVSDTNYGWGPPDLDTGYESIGDHTDIGYLYNWFAGPNSSAYLQALYAENGENTGSPYSRLARDPGGENEIVVIKSCFTNSALGGSPNDPAATVANPLRGQGSGSEVQTVGNAKGIYDDLLGYFATRQDKLFVLVTSPPLIEADTTPEAAANARALSRWLSNDWLADYPYGNVVVFDLFDTLTSNGGNFSAYGTEDSHPGGPGLQKATGEFVTMLNSSYQAWRSR
ncbi:MAG: hypothetical protein ACYCW5_00970 [Thermoleophilia bacterium]